jgi:hypothetical protein
VIVGMVPPNKNVRYYVRFVNVDRCDLLRAGMWALQGAIDSARAAGPIGESISPNVIPTERSERRDPLRVRSALLVFFRPSGYERLRTCPRARVAER